MANPAYGVSIRPEEILNDSLQAQNDPQQRKDFFAKSLNVYSSAIKAYFNIDEFRKSDQKVVVKSTVETVCVVNGRLSNSELFDNVFAPYLK